MVTYVTKSLLFLGPTSVLRGQGAGVPWVQMRMSLSA